MSSIAFDLTILYRQIFGGKPFIVGNEETASELPAYIINGQKNDVSQMSGSALTAEYLGKEIWLPVKFVGLNPSDFNGVSEIFLPYTVIKLSAKKTIVKTPLAERKGTVKEMFNFDDYSISLKGFVIDEANRVWPEQELIILKKLWELGEAIQLDNALTNIFLDKDTRVVIEDFDLPEVEGGRKHIRPFSFKLESDSVFTLEVES